MRLRMKYLKHTKFFLVVLIFTSTISFSQKVKIDGVGVVVGKNIVLDSDIEKFKLDLEQSTEGKVKISDCEMLEQLMLQKLLAHHAVVDSVVVSDAEVNAAVNNNLNFFVGEYKSMDKVLQIYGFNDEADLRNELFKIEKENALIKKEQQKITEKIDVTPEEVRIYYNGLKEKKELPEFPAEIEIAHLVIKAKPEEGEEQRIIDKLNRLRQEIIDGSSFRLKAIINSDDPAVSQNGGQYSITKDSPFIKEFKEVVFSLELNEISRPFKSDFGYHIIQLHTIKGETREASHILIQPDIPQANLDKAKEDIEKIRKDVLAGKMTFEEAAKKFSDDKETKKNGGLIVNPYSGEHRFDLTRLDPALYARVNELKKEEITEPFYEEDRSGEKMYKIIYMKDRTDRHIADLVDDYVKIQSLALQKKKQEKIASWSKEKITDTYIKISSEYNKCKFERDWKKNAN